MIYDNSLGFGKGLGMWIIPLGIILVVVYALRYRRKK